MNHFRLVFILDIPPFFEADLAETIGLTIGLHWLGEGIGTISSSPAPDDPLAGVFASGNL